MKSYFLFLICLLGSINITSADFKFEDKGLTDPDFDCELKSYQNGKWKTESSSALQGLILSVQYKAGNTRPFTKVKNIWYTSKPECFVKTAKKPPTQILKTKTLTQKSVKNNSHSNYLLSAELIYFSQNYTTTSTANKNYTIIGNFFGIDLGVQREITQAYGFSFGAGVEAFAGLMTAKVDTGTTPKPNFSYSAKNYFEFGFKVFPTIEKYLSSNLRLALQPGLGLSFVSLPAPVTTTTKYSAPEFSLFYFFTQISSTYFLNQNLGLSLGLGFMQSPTQLMIQSGFSFKL